MNIHALKYALVGALLLAVPATAVDTLVATGSVWGYLDNGSDQGTAWRSPSFNDSGWAVGPAELGYGDSDEATVISYGGNSNSKYTTTYYRHTFSVADPSLYSSLTLDVLRDDGAIVYLNGTEVYRGNMPGGSVSYTTWASTALSSLGAVRRNSSVNRSQLQTNMPAFHR